ncbi:transglutaminaseTgpA domain-containing protein [Georgenia sp. 10Sc9-8]|uniref:TransglutaminaseTgpA domain-containing protein n=1 Tax=Georgenia halotolerans TaxID=3028317 RepID=A0ABT5U0K5_9MICO|nr:transglutaminaseTgpA domain-containing protein [Georgenia halotolerans]
MGARHRRRAPPGRVMIARARGLEAVLAAVATLVSAWAVTGLLRHQPWIDPTIVLLVVVVLVGSVTRAARWPAPAVLAAQAALVTLVGSWLMLPGHHWYGLPRPSAAVETARLLQEAVRTIRTEAVPAPAEPGLVLLVVLSITAVGLAVDLLGVTLRSPALAGLPLLTVVTVTASNTGEALHPKYFLATAAAWLLLVAQQELTAVRSWPVAADGSPTSEGDPLVERGVRRQGSRARAIGGLTVVLAVVVPAVLPHLPPTAVVQGLSRGAASGSGQVSFTETLDLAQDLASRSTRPVLRYRTDASRPAPLRVAVSTRYTEGSWQPTEQEAELWASGPLPPPEAPAGQQVSPVEQTVTVVENNLRAPQLAAPYPLVELDVGDIRWSLRDGTGTVRVWAQPESYAATYWSYPATGRLPEGVGTGTPSAEALAEAGGPSLLAADDASLERVTTLVQELTADAADPLEAAMAIQSYLRSSAFTYSLELAGPVEGPDGQPLDPISHFLETKQGYCTQFASAMVMMARAYGIPARLAVGFLPGEEGTDGARTVLASDAHAWPELYLDGLGWSRFEPTPADRTGTAPVYRREQDLAAPAPVAPEPTVDTPDRSGQPVLPGADPTSADEEQQRNRGALVAAAIAVTVLAAAWFLVPAAGQRARTAPRRAARSGADRAEAAWHLLLTDLADLGIPGPVGATPRQVARHYQQVAPLGGATRERLARTAHLVEQARYAPGDVDPGAVEEDVHQVVAAVRSTRSRRDQLRARLWPRSGTAALRAAVTGAGSAVRRSSRAAVAAVVARRHGPSPSRTSGGVPRSLS